MGARASVCAYCARAHVDRDEALRARHGGGGGPGRGRGAAGPGIVVNLAMRRCPRHRQLEDVAVNVPLTPLWC